MAKAPITKATLTIAGSRVEVTQEVVAIGSLRLNPDNPRIRFLLKRTGGKSDHKSLLALIKTQPGYDPLQKAIRKASGLHEPIIVSHDDVVVEGNTRTAVVTTLHEGSKTDNRWKTVPVVRLPKGVELKSMAMLMAAYHIAGKTRWRAYAQAEHIHELSKTYGYTVTQIADETRMTEREVQQYIDAYSYLVDEVLPHAKSGNETEILETKFSHALEFIKHKKAKQLRDNPAVRKVVAQLIVQNKIKGAEVRELDKVLANKKATSELKKSGFKAGKKVLTENDPLSGSKTLKQMEGLIRLLAKLGQEELQSMKKSAPARKLVKDLRASIDAVAAVIGVDKK